MQSDPHDALLLANRPTTVVTQHTRMHDRMPAPFGAQEDEEALFAGVGADNGAAAMAQKLTDDKNNLLNAIRGIAPGAPADGRIVVAAPAPSKVPMLALAALGIGAAWFLFLRK